MGFLKDVFGGGDGTNFVDVSITLGYETAA